MTNNKVQKRNSLVDQMFGKPLDKKALLERSAKNKEAAKASTINSSAAVKAVSKSLTSVEERNKKLKEMISEGTQAVELDPALVEASFIRDRLSLDGDAAFDQLQSSIAESGQQVPILVRSHPQKDGRYQIAYGHRRWMACKSLGKKVLAFVRELTDEQLLIAQGQENHERKNLSYLETVLFCTRLSENYPQTVICKAVGKAKSTVSMYLKLARELPAEGILERVGAAPAIGRPRWEEFAALWQAPNVQKAVEEFLETVSNERFDGVPSDDRFKMLLSIAKRSSSKSSSTNTGYKSDIGPNKEIQMKQTNQRLTLEVDLQKHPEFAEFLQKNLSDLINRFREEDVMTAT
ncbi:plasmid partitioning protein RepB [Pseudovibrio brasiliensis]|uniref:Plasmid partitioning protein RepB n=1 Tax=Pseudovibrio brasiliensis TaxID=1898042 RepID=A0ABX8AZC0_9HYPH|nr:plasmid partitioning protein RepB [Pseudovibrio brasiliensis]QUS59031.1 plasmid partitioning protein RepB [Pseudovibrio brasiliensis]